MLLIIVFSNPYMFCVLNLIIDPNDKVTTIIKYLNERILVGGWRQRLQARRANFNVSTAWQSTVEIRPDILDIYLGTSDD